MAAPAPINPALIPESEKAVLDPTTDPRSEQPQTTVNGNEGQHSSFTSGQKKLIVLGASIGSFFSPLSSNIYLPALNVIAADLHVSNALINLTVTTYLILQGLAPTFVGGFADSAGRRPAYIICFVIYMIANLGLALQNDYVALMILRCVQSAGSSGTVALANAVVADVVTSSERGQYIGWASVASILGPSLSPVIGGLLSQYLGWKWIFWFLLILGATYLVVFFIVFPETCRKIVGDGSIPPPFINHSVVSYVREKKRIAAGQHLDFAKRDELAAKRRLRFPNPLAVLRIVTDKETILILISNGLVISAFYGVSTTIPSQFKRIYGYDELKISLVFLPIGVGSLISAFTTGKFIDWNYRRHALRLGFPMDRKRQQDLTDFPIERARLEVAIPFLYLGAVSIISFGWCLHFQTHVVGPLILMFFIGYSLIAGSNAMSIVLVDTHSDSPATATAANNLVRCSIGAAQTAVMIPMVNAWGDGWALTFWALVWVAFSPLLWILMRKGPQWRRQKKDKMEKQKLDCQKT